MYVPEEATLRKEVIRRYHDDLLAGHYGPEKTLTDVKQKYWWPRIGKDVTEYVKRCDVCQRTKAPRHRPHGRLAQLPIPTGCWKELSMDFIVELPESYLNGVTYDAILVVVDRYSKVAHCFPVKGTIIAQELADLLWDRIFLRYGSPQGIVSDRDSLFTSHFWTTLCFHARIKRKLSTSFHPQTDGQTERQNQVVEQYLRCYCNYKQDNWAMLLTLAEFAYNTAVHASTGAPPYQVLMGYVPSFEWELEAEPPYDVPAAKARIETLHEERQRMEKHLAKAREYQATAANKRMKDVSFVIGERVLLSAKHLETTRPKKKLGDRFVGPFEIKDLVGSQAYRLVLPERWQIHDVFHVSQLEKYTQGADSIDPPQVELIDGQEEWEVEEILDERTRYRKPQFLVRWKGYPRWPDKWISRKDLDNSN